MKHQLHQSTGPRRRGTVAVLVAISLVVLLGFAALAIDVANLYTARGELQRAADAAALAGASAFADDLLRQATYADDPDGDFTIVKEAAAARAVTWALKNTTVGVSTKLEPGYVVVGAYNPAHPTAPLSPFGPPNAVEVTARFAEGSPNGPVSNYFASVLGFENTDVTATAAAAFDDHFAGYTPSNSGPLVPFTIYLDTYLQQLASGPDEFSYDADLDVVKHFADGSREIVLFPYATGGGDGAGNFGLLNVGNPSQGVPLLREQILNGITPENLEAEIGTSQLTFVAGSGAPITYEITGSPGMKGGVSAAVDARIGDVVGFFVHSALVGTGSNAVYTIVTIRFGRVMEVRLTGSPANRRIRVQPAVWSDPGVQIDPNAPSSGGLVGRIVLIR